MEIGIESVLAVAGYFTAHRRIMAEMAKTCWRLLGLLPIALALTGIGQGSSQHMFGRDLIVARTDDELLVLRRRGHQYELDRLARHHGVAVREISCRPHCRLTLKGGIEFAYHDRLSGFARHQADKRVIHAARNYSTPALGQSGKYAFHKPDWRLPAQSFRLCGASASALPHGLQPAQRQFRHYRLWHHFE